MTAFWTLICARGWRVPPAGDLRIALGIEWRVLLPLEIHLGLFAGLMALMVAAWVFACRGVAASTLRLPSVLAGACLLAVPLVLLTGLYSDDVYLYHFYGRELALYGANPFTTAPSAFADDPHLQWVYWKWLPSAYGPLWLAISAPLSALAGESIAAAIVLYRIAGLAAHLLTAFVIYAVARSVRREHAVTAAAFYAWNPLALFESVASAHNDALVAALLCAAAWTVVRRRPAVSGALLGCAMMVKPFAILAAIPLAAATWTRCSPGRRSAGLILCGGAAVLTAGALYAPFNVGDALLRNILANPASGTYMNSLWELVAVQAAGWSGPDRAWVERALDPWRISLLAFAVVGGAIVSLRSGRLESGLLVLWIGFCFAQAWTWPWYFLPIVAMAAFAGPRAQRIAAALTLGGLLFYTGWPPPTKSLAWIYTGRSLLLFGPVLAVLVFEGYGIVVRRARAMPGVSSRLVAANREAASI